MCVCVCVCVCVRCFYYKVDGYVREGVWVCGCEYVCERELARPGRVSMEGAVL